jgi:hypothetical protein
MRGGAGRGAARCVWRVRRVHRHQVPAVVARLSDAAGAVEYWDVAAQLQTDIASSPFLIAMRVRCTYGRCRRRLVLPTAPSPIKYSRARGTGSSPPTGAA